MENCKTWGDLKVGDVVYAVSLYDAGYFDYRINNIIKCVVKETNETDDPDKLAVLLSDHLYFDDTIIQYCDIHRFEFNDWVFYTDKEDFKNDMDTYVKERQEEIDGIKNSINIITNFAL